MAHCGGDARLGPPDPFLLSPTLTHDKTLQALASDTVPGCAAAGGGTGCFIHESGNALDV